MADSDPLLMALVAKLPPSGTDWPVERQLAWLNLTAMAFGVIYGGDAAYQVASETTARPPKADVPGAVPATRPAPQKPAVRYGLIIDTEGYARRGTGQCQRIMPSDVNETIYDMRGDTADLRSITWADDSTGLNGRDLIISAA